MNGHYSIDPIIEVICFQVAIRQAEEATGKASGKVGLEAIEITIEEECNKWAESFVTSVFTGGK